MSAEEWDHLVDRIGAEPWMTHGWISAWHDVFGRGPLQVFTVRRNGELVALAPFERVRGALVAPSNYHTPTFHTLVSDDDAAAELADRLSATRPCRIDASFVPMDLERTLPLLDGPYRSDRRVLERSPYIDIKGTFEEYRSQRSSKMLRDIERRRRRMLEQGALELVVEDGTRHLDGLLDEGFVVEAAAWKGDEGTAITARADTDRFYRSIGEWAAARGILRLVFARIEGRAVAFDYAIEANGRHFVLKVGYDPELRAYSPAMILRHDMIKRCFALDLASYEFLGSDQPFKLQWTDTVRERSRVQLFAPTPAGALDRAAWRHGRPAALQALNTARTLSERARSALAERRSPGDDVAS